jgi:hypothetical protein
MGLPSLRDSPIGMGQTLRFSEQKRNAPDINVLLILFCTHTLDSALSFQWGYQYISFFYYLKIKYGQCIYIVIIFTMYSQRIQITLTFQWSKSLMGISLEKKPNSPRLNEVERKYIAKYGRVQFNDHYRRIKSYNTMYEVIESNHKNGRHYFDPDTMIAWNSKTFHFENTCFIDRVYSPSFMFLRELPKYTYKVMVVLEKGRLKNWAICDSMKEAQKEQQAFLNMHTVEIERILNLNHI